MVRIKIKKYKILPCQVFKISNLLIIKSLLCLLKVFFSLIIKLNNEFFLISRHFSNLINIDLMKGYFGLRFSILFSIELIVCSGIFEI